MLSIGTNNVNRPKDVAQVPGNERRTSGDNLDDSGLNLCWDDHNESFHSVDYLAAFVLSCLHSARTSDTSLGNAHFLVPDGLTPYIAGEIKALSVVEPYGVRGCALCIGVQDPKTKAARRLGRWVFDRSIVSTFEITLCFKEDSLRNHWALRALSKLLPRRGSAREGASFNVSGSGGSSSSSFRSRSMSSGSGKSGNGGRSLVLSKDVEIFKKRYFRPS